MSDCNFSFRNNLAYTEDSILVYNLFIYKISRRVNENDFKQYFKKFGEFVKFLLIAKPGIGRRRGSRHGFVNFKNAETAAAVLRKQMHIISTGKVFSVKACDSWRQPNLNNNNTTINSVDTVTDVTNTTKKLSLASQPSSPANIGLNIVDLNEDVLLILLNKLQLRDQVSLARCHHKFENLFKQHAKINYKEITTEQMDQMSLWNIRQFFILAGEYFEKFTFTDWYQNKDRERISSFVQLHCPNLKQIKVDTVKIRMPCLNRLLFKKEKLKILIFHCVSLNDHCIYAVKKLPSLEHLNISNSSYFTGRLLYLLPQLKTLRLYGCCNLKTACLQKAINVMRNLTALDVRGAERLQQAVFDSLPKRSKNLKILQMSCIDVNYDNIARLPNLRCIGLNCGNFSGSLLRVSVFRSLAEEGGDRLESLQINSCQCINQQQCDFIAQLKGLKKLHIQCNAGINDNSLEAFCSLSNLVELKLDGCKNFTNDALLKLIQNCPKMKWLNVERTSIDNDFFKKLIILLKKEKRENGPLIILVCDTAMFPNYCFSELYSLEIKNMVQFMFEHATSHKNYDNLYDEFENNFNGIEEIPFFKIGDYAYDEDSDEDYEDDFYDDDDDFDFDDVDDDDLDIVLNLPLLQALRFHYGPEFGYHNDSDDEG